MQELFNTRLNPVGAFLFIESPLWPSPFFSNLLASMEECKQMLNDTFNKKQDDNKRDCLTFEIFWLNVKSDIFVVFLKEKFRRQKALHSAEEH